jgi:fluoride exporter
VTPSGERRPGAAHELPIDPDVDTVEDARHHRHAIAADIFVDEAVTAPERLSRWPRFRLSVVATVFAGGCVGGLARYLADQHWPGTSGLFPWPTFTVNIVGAFVLALLVVVVTDVLDASTYLRPLIGTGFCGALTTFSSVVVDADRLIAHGHAGVATTYVSTSIVAGLAAALLGLALGRAYANGRQSIEAGTS